MANNPPQPREPGYVIDEAINQITSRSQDFRYARLYTAYGNNKLSTQIDENGRFLVSWTTGVPWVLKYSATRPGYFFIILPNLMNWALIPGGYDLINPHSEKQLWKRSGGYIENKETGLVMTLDATGFTFAPPQSLESQHWYIEEIPNAMLPKPGSVLILAPHTVYSSTTGTNPSLYPAAAHYAPRFLEDGIVDPSEAPECFMCYPAFTDTGLVSAELYTIYGYSESFTKNTRWVEGLYKWLNTAGLNEGCKEYNMGVWRYVMMKSGVCEGGMYDSSTNVCKGPLYEQDNTAMSKCIADNTASWFVTKNSRGSMCRIWDKSRESDASKREEQQSYKDSIKTSWCNRNPNRPECKCLNRFRDPIYLATKPSMVVNDYCWYKPCFENVDNDVRIDSEVLVPWNMVKTPYYTPPSCPESNCTNVIRLVNNRAITLQDLTQNTNCNAGNPPTVPPPVNPPNNPSDDLSKEKLNTKVIWGVAAAVGLVGAGLGIALTIILVKKNKNIIQK